MPLLHLASRLYGTPLLIARAKLDLILAVLGPRIGVHGLAGCAPVAQANNELDTAGLTPSAARPDALERKAQGSVSEHSAGIAVIPIHGTLVRRALGVEAASGLASYGQIGAQLDAALADPAVQGILLDIDSPGGEAGGVFELAQRIRAGSKRKPIWAHANDSAYSAAYALGCAAQRLTLTPTGGVGSIGVIALHVDQSLYDAREGLTYTAICAGAHKNDFSPHAPLAQSARAALQAEVDRLWSIFITHVAEMRGVKPTAVRDLQAALLHGPQAVAAGLADEVTGLEQVLEDFGATLQRGPPRTRLLRQPTQVPQTSQTPQTPQGDAAAPPVSVTLSAPDHSTRNPPMDDPQAPPQTLAESSPPAQTAAQEPIPPETPSASSEDDAAEGPDQDIAEVTVIPAGAAVAPTPLVEATAARAASTPRPGPVPAADPAAAAQQAAANAQLVAELCLLAGCPERTAGFLSAGLGPDHVRHALLAARAERSERTEIASRIEVGAAVAPQMSAALNPLLAAVKRLHPGAAGPTAASSSTAHHKE